MEVDLKRDALPEHVRGLPVEVQIAVLYERVGNLADTVNGLKTLIISGIATLLIGLILGAVSFAAGWFGPRAAVTAGRALWSLFA